MEQERSGSAVGAPPSLLPSFLPFLQHQHRSIHVFLGAPAPSSGPASFSDSPVEGGDRPPADWRQLELTWRNGRLKPATDEPVNPGASSAEEKKAEEACEASDREGQCSASLHAYLNSCFPAAPTEPDPAPPDIAPLSAHTQYLTTWTLSQTMVLRNTRGIHLATSPGKPHPPPKDSPPSVSSSTPELFSPRTPSLQASAELFSQRHPTPRAEDGGVILQSTTEGLLCSQESSSPTTPPSSKKTRVSEDAETPATKIQPSSIASTGPTTLLSQCGRPGARYSVLVAVVHPCHVKEVQVRNGPSAGTSVPLGSVVVTDQSGVDVKVVLWRRAAFWALTVGPGDVLLITGLQVNEDRWRGETVLQSTFSSRLLNVGQITHQLSPQAPRQVDAHTFTSLCTFLRRRRPLLVSLPSRPRQDLSRLPYATMRSLRADMMVHARLRVTHTHTSPAWRTEASSCSRSAVQLMAVLTVEQVEGQEGTLVLWGSAVDWLQRFKENRATVWDFRVLLVREGLTSDLLELHSTPWSSVRPLDPAHLPQTRLTRPGHSSGSLELDLDTLLSQKYSGDVELRVQVTSFRFQDAASSQNAPQPVLDSSTPLWGIQEALSGDITYTGCGRCCAELDTDANGIYTPCYACLPHTSVRCYYRPGVLTLSGRGSSQVRVQVPPVPLQKILEAPPDRLHRSSGGSEVKLIQVAAERMRTLLHLPPPTFTACIRSHFLCDENSVAINQDLTLLDLHFPNSDTDQQFVRR